MKKIYLLAMALAAMVSCTSDDFVGDQAVRESNENAAISFGFDVPTVTRASGAGAATALSNQFVVYGEKSETTDGAAPAAGKLVFQNYKVAYTASTAYTTQSNTKNWEYVGQNWTDEEHANITTSTTDVQTIKYWDYSATNYVFTAVSALPADIQNGRVKITKITNAASSDNEAYDKGYTITLAKSGSAGSYVYPTFNKIFLSDRQVISSDGAGTDREAINKYGGNVTLTFRNMLSQVRAGVYETIPGYDVTEIKFYVGSGQSTLATKTVSSETKNAFGALAPNTTVNDFEGSLKVTYYNSGTLINQPKVAINSGSTAAKTDLVLGTNLSTISTSSPLGIVSNNPTWDTANGDYTEVLPQIDNTTNLKLKVDYKLYNSVSGEVIEVKGATAEVPGKYLAWKPNFKYTYLFKISDNSNGQTGTGTTPAGLYPITFDAIVVEAQDGQAEYITTVSEPSITTFGTHLVGEKTVYVTQGGDYPAGSDIYATFMENSTVQTPVLSGDDQNVKVYYVTASDATKITEASVAESVANPTNNVVTATLITSSNSSTYFTSAPAAVTTVPGEDGVDITNTHALKLEGVKIQGTADTYYAIEYNASSAWTGQYTKVYKIIKIKYVAPSGSRD